VLSSRAEELLSNAYTQSVSVNTSEIAIEPFVLSE